MTECKRCRELEAWLEIAKLERDAAIDGEESISENQRERLRIHVLHLLKTRIDGALAGKLISYCLTESGLSDGDRDFLAEAVMSLKTPIAE